METFAKICVVASLETLREDPTVRIHDKQAAWKLLSKMSRTAPDEVAVGAGKKTHSKYKHHNNIDFKQFFLDCEILSPLHLYSTHILALFVKADLCNLYVTISWHMYSNVLCVCARLCKYITTIFCC